jgi:MscS family membrane protein
MPGPGAETTTEALTMITWDTIIQVLVVAGVTWLLSRSIRWALNALAERFASRRILIKNFIPIISLTLNLTAAFYILFGIFQVNQDNLLAFGISAGVAIGFAIQDLLANFFAGLVIVFTKPFNIGDKIEVGEYYGEVQEVSLLRVKINTPDDSLVNIPNKMFLQLSVSNANSGALDCQVVTQFRVPLGIDLQRVKAVAREAAFVTPTLLLSKPVTVVLSELMEGPVPFFQVKVKSYVADHRWEFLHSTAILEKVQKVLASEIAQEYRNLQTTQRIQG